VRSRPPRQRPPALAPYRPLKEGRHLLKVWLSDHEHTTLNVADEDVFIDLVARVCKKKNLVRSEYKLQYRPDPAKPHKLADLDTTLQYRQAFVDEHTSEVFLTKSTSAARGRPTAGCLCLPADGVRA